MYVTRQTMRPTTPIKKTINKSSVRGGYCIDQGAGKSSVTILFDLAPCLSTTHDGAPVIVYETNNTDREKIL